MLCYFFILKSICYNKLLLLVPGEKLVPRIAKLVPGQQLMVQVISSYISQTKWIYYILLLYNDYFWSSVEQQKTTLENTPRQRLEIATAVHHRAVTNGILTTVCGGAHPAPHNTRRRAPRETRQITERRCSTQRRCYALR